MIRHRSPLYLQGHSATTTINLYWKNSCSHPNGITFPADRHITHTENHWANESSMKDYITKVIVPYIERIRSELPQSHEPSPQPALVIFDVFKGHMCQTTINLLMENNIHFVHMPPNCTDRLQPLDISVNKPCKDFMRNKFIEWYSLKVCEASENIENPCPQIDLRLSTMKPLGAQWQKLFYDYMQANPEIIKN